jgi:6-phosphogluconolactonase/glucosamine-6-phosphate isomerase/deaminase
MEIIHTDKPAVVAGEEVGRLLEQYKDTPILLLLSGGSAFSLLENVPVSVLDSRITLGVLDERYDTNPAVNNFAQLSATAFFKQAVLAGASYIDTQVASGETLQNLGLRFNHTLSQWRKNNPSGVVLITLGLGQDGHTAGLLPGYVEEVSWSGVLAMGYEVDPSVNPYTKRVTVTSRFLKNEVTAGVAYVAGSDKCPVLARLLRAEGEIETCPALLWHSIPELTVVTECQEINESTPLT